MTVEDYIVEDRFFNAKVPKLDRIKDKKGIRARDLIAVRWPGAEYSRTGQYEYKTVAVVRNDRKTCSLYLKAPDVHGTVTVKYDV